jgi:hypothetical protein
MEEKVYPPQFMRDDTQKDGHAETIMDYVISWCIRRADKICSHEKPILYSHCRYILGTLLGIKKEDLSNTTFHNVKVWKQNQYIDLWVELDVEVQGNTSKYALLIENKYYTGLHNATNIDGQQQNQLTAYKNIFDAHYAGKQNENWQTRYALITCLERNSTPFNKHFDPIIEPEFNVFSFYDLLENEIQTESDLFNEFWYRWGDPSF